MQNDGRGGHRPKSNRRLVFDMGRRVLVTGSEGFTGRYVCQALVKAGWEVWGSGVAKDGSSSPYIRLNVLEPDSIKNALSKAQPHVVIHLAAISFAAETDPSRYYNVNLLGTRNLLSGLSCMDRTPEQVILASTANVYGNSDQIKLAETCSAKPENDYAISKLGMELLSNVFKNRLNISITRPFNYTGVGQNDRFLIPKIVSHVKRRAPFIELGNVEVERDFSDVRDIARYYVALAESNKAAGLINFCSGRSVSLKSILQIAAERSGHVMRVSVTPRLKREQEVFRLLGDRGKLDKIASERIDFDIDSTIEWMLAAP